MKTDKPAGSDVACDCVLPIDKISDSSPARLDQVKTRVG